MNAKISNGDSKSVLTMGELLWDMLPTGKKPGGAPANFVYHAAQNGVKALGMTSSAMNSCSCSPIAV